LESQGIEQFTMRSLAKELNIKAPTIYWYFENKQILFQALADTVARKIIPNLPKEGSWRIQLLQSAWIIRGELQRYTCSAQMFIKTKPESDFKELINCLLEMMKSTPLSEKHKIWFIYHVFNFVVNFAVDEYERKAFTVSEENQEESSLNNHLIQQHGDYPDELFESGIQLLLSGIECKVLEASKREE